jgi:hypothetical protein
VTAMRMQRLKATFSFRCWKDADKKMVEILNEPIVVKLAN